jgi:ABC-type amino acid transport substrate-binding protein
VLRYLEHESFAGKVASPAPAGLVGFAVQLHSPLRRPIDVAMLEALAEPSWQEIVRKYFGSDAAIQLD